MANQVSRQSGSAVRESMKTLVNLGLVFWLVSSLWARSTIGAAAAQNLQASPDATLTPAEADAPITGQQIRQPNPEIRVAFQVKYVADGVAYLDSGRNAGLAEGMKLVVRDGESPSVLTGINLQQGKIIAELEILSVALASAVAEIRNPTRALKAGDWAYLSWEDTEALVAQRSLSTTRIYPAVVSFSEGDPLDEEVRDEVPRPPLPEINRARGRIGFDYSGILSHGTSHASSTDIGLLARADVTRINGTYWNLRGYWRGRISSRSPAGQTTLQDLINRTYHLGLSYDNPRSRLVAGVGRLYLPWASSLDTIDGGYFGLRSGRATIGIFAGSTPDPTSWSFNPDRRIGGTFVNLMGGSFDDFYITSTSGVGISTLNWKIDRPFIFFEHGISYKRYLSIYHSLQADSPSGNPVVAAPGPGLNRSFLTLRLQPGERIEFDLNHTYFRDIPSFDPQLIGTGLLDKYLFQGFSGGTRVQLFRNVWLYASLGRSNRSGDTHASLNQLHGLALGHLPRTRIRADLHYSRFTSSFGGGSYQSLLLSRNFRENLRWEVLAGRQSFASLNTNQASRFVNGNIEAALGSHYFLQTGYTWDRGRLQSYDQWLFTLGYRFDSRSKAK